ncbi:MAG: c-type cytochrome [Acidobacteriota bacterium]|nr:c-type cytochrome [Acidobacteriota bacterium]
MRLVCLRLAILPAVSAILFSATCFAADQDTAVTSVGEIQAKIQYCQDCHGPSGQGYPGFSPIPRIAGQTTKYMETQLLAFIELRRDANASMSKVHVLSVPMRTALAAHFSDLDPEPIGDGPKDLVAAGRKIYAEGIPEANVPACSACHGPEAKGKAQISRLAGQLYPYTVKELDGWVKERGRDPGKADIASVMTPIAHALSHPQIAAVAAYLSYLK